MNFLLTREAKWYRVVFFGIVFMLIPAVLQSAWAAYRTHHYQTAPMSNFYEGIELVSDSICFGDTTQKIETVRNIYGTKTGWKSDVVRELFRDEKSIRIKVFEDEASVFLEKKEGGKVTRESALPVQPVGLYHWEVNFVRLYLPYGVIRVDAQPLIGNGFAIEECTEPVIKVKIIE